MSGRILPAGLAWASCPADRGVEPPVESRLGDVHVYRRARRHAAFWGLPWLSQRCVRYRSARTRWRCTARHRLTGDLDASRPIHTYASGHAGVLHAVARRRTRAGPPLPVTRRHRFRRYGHRTRQSHQRRSIATSRIDVLSSANTVCGPDPTPRGHSEGSRCPSSGGSRSSTLQASGRTRCRTWSTSEALARPPRLHYGAGQSCTNERTSADPLHGCATSRPATRST